MVHAEKVSYCSAARRKCYIFLRVDSWLRLCGVYVSLILSMLYTRTTRSSAMASKSTFSLRSRRRIMNLHHPVSFHDNGLIECEEPD